MLLISGLVRATCFLSIAVACSTASCRSQTLESSAQLGRAVAKTRAERALSANIVLTWRTGGVTRETRGTIQLEKPNLARIALRGDYPEILLISDGRSRFLVPDDTTFQKSAIDTTGTGVDSPWWALPFRFFFTQSVNPFGAAPDLNASYVDVGSNQQGLEPRHKVAVRGTSPMGAYTEALSFNDLGDLVESEVRFGEGPGAAVFQAKMTDIRHRPIDSKVFRFHAASGQIATRREDTMLTVGAEAPDFQLRTPEGYAIDLKERLRGRKAVLLNFWFYNCAPCRVEFPEIEKLYQRYEAQGLDVLAIDRADTSEVVASYARKAGLSFPTLLSGEPDRGSVFASFKVADSFPATYLLDERGRIVYRSNGEDLDGLRRALADVGFR